MDERMGLPSASGIERIALCPGSFRLEQGQPDTASAESESGTRIHAWLAGELSIDALSPDECELGQSIVTLTEKVIEQWTDSL